MDFMDLERQRGITIQVHAGYLLLIFLIKKMKIKNAKFSTVYLMILENNDIHKLSF